MGVVSFFLTAIKAGDVRDFGRLYINTNREGKQHRPAPNIE